MSDFPAQTLTGGRLQTLDAIRGVAVMGILLMNIVAFALPSAAYFNPLAAGHAGDADLWAWAIAYVLVDGKMRGLFSFLFGASMLLVVDRARASGRSGAAVHYARMLVLLGFGIVHFTFVWYGDILNHYAVIGMIAFAFVSLRVRTLAWMAAALFAISTLIFTASTLGFAGIRADAMKPHASAAAIADWQANVDAFGVPAPATVAKEVAIYRGPYSGMVRDRIDHHAGDAVQILIFGGAETLGLMLAGMAGLKSGFLTGAWDRRRYLRWAGIAYLIGIPPAIALAWLTWHNGFDALTVFATGLIPTPLRVATMIGHASLILALLKGASGPSAALLTATGRMAFSNYLGTSLLMTTLFYGFGWFGMLPRAWLYHIPPLVWLLMLAWSKPWLDRFQYGPMEWLWRSLARGRVQPMRRQMRPNS